MHDLIITEIMIDPQPSVGLPDTEYIELLNLSGSQIDLSEVTLADRSRSVTLPHYSMAPMELVVLAPIPNAGFSQSTWLTLESWPVLNNSDDHLLLYQGSQLPHSVAYDNHWLEDPLKKDGGWSLELIDWNYPCSGRINWSASVDSTGGTPGRLNSIAAVRPDRTPPVLQNIAIPNPHTVRLNFDQPLNPASIPQLQWSLNPHIEVDTIYLPVVYQPQLQIEFGSSLQEQEVYDFSISNLVDCNGNVAKSAVMGKLALPRLANRDDIIINEIMFDPAATSEKYLEIFNKSSKAINLKNWSWSKVTNGQYSDPHLITQQELIIFPGDYMVHTESVAKVKAHFPNAPDDTFLEVSSLPGLSSGGIVTLLDQRRYVVDSLNFHPNMHHELLVLTEGVALERIDPHASSLDPLNWISAPQSRGFGSPGSANQHRFDAKLNSSVAIIPPSFDPYGASNYVGIYYQFAQSGNVISISIFDYQGYLINTLVPPTIASNEGVYFWDGSDQEGHIVNPGVYIILVKQRDVQGSFRSFKNPIVVTQSN